MTQVCDNDALAREIAEMGRQTVVDRLMNFRGSFPMDFTPEFLAGLSLDKLQHLLLAAHLYSRRGDAGTR